VAAARRFCAADIGSNSIKVRVVEAGNGLRKTLHDARFPVRLGAGSFGGGGIPESDVEAAVVVFQEIAAVCRRLEVSRARGVATSAMREAANSGRVIGRVREQTGFEVEVVTGAEEARLLALGVRLEIGANSPCLVVDVGGGSTEIVAVGAGNGIQEVHSLPLGAVRLQQTFKPSAPAADDDCERIRAHVNAVLERSRTGSVVAGIPVIGVAGTMCALLDIRRVLRAGGDDEFTRNDLHEAVCRLRKMTHGEMASRFGLDPLRAQIILPGGLIVAGLMDFHAIAEIRVSLRDLRDGILEEMIGSARMGSDEGPAGNKQRETAVEQE
jgi:exopolyphosphatase/guanosine-5'-triphosphate,3'-diphosphate pyrophosphatase